MAIHLAKSQNGVLKRIPESFGQNRLQCTRQISASNNTQDALRIFLKSGVHLPLAHAMQIIIRSVAVIMVEIRIRSVKLVAIWIERAHFGIHIPESV